MTSPFFLAPTLRALVLADVLMSRTQRCSSVTTDCPCETGYARSTMMVGIPIDQSGGVVLTPGGAGPDFATRVELNTERRGDEDDSNRQGYDHSGDRR